MKYFNALVLSLIPVIANAGQDLSYNTYDPETELAFRHSLTGPVTASIYVSNAPSNSNLYAPAEVFLLIEDSTEDWWVHTPQSYDSMDIIEFIGSTHLLVSLSTPAASFTATLDLTDRSLKLIGSGSGAVISSDPENVLIRLAGQRGYSEGVFWYSSVTDLEGRVIEFLSDGNNCVTVADLVSDQEDLSKLRQPMDYCVGVQK